MAGRVTVVGAGVLGLSCAVRLAEAGFEVDVLARELPAETMSATDPGLWLPVPAEPADAVARWASETLAELRRVAASTDGAAGGGADDGSVGIVRILPGTLLSLDPHAVPALSRSLGSDVPPAEVRDPAPGHTVGHQVELPVVDVPRYLGLLGRRLAAAGGTLTRLAVPALPTRGLVVNCTGVAARALARDPLVRPVRGQSLLVADPGLDRWWYDDGPDALTFVVPRGRDVVVGGTLDDDQWDPVPDEATAQRLLDRATRLVPALRGVRVLGHRVGLRPSRPVIRVEAEASPTSDDPRHVRVHCYGHGRNGVTLSWGSAGAVVDLVRSGPPSPHPRGDHARLS